MKEGKGSCSPKMILGTERLMGQGTIGQSFQGITCLDNELQCYE